MMKACGRLRDRDDKDEVEKQFKRCRCTVRFVRLASDHAPLAYLKWKAASTGPTRETRR
jgi:hypothetical protein